MSEENPRLVVDIYSAWPFHIDGKDVFQACDIAAIPFAASGIGVTSQPESIFTVLQ